MGSPVAARLAMPFVVAQPVNTVVTAAQAAPSKLSLIRMINTSSSCVIAASDGRRETHPCVTGSGRIRVLPRFARSK